MAIATYFLAAVIQPFCLYMILGLVLERRWEKLPLWVHSILATLALQPPTIIRGISEPLFDLMAYVQLIVMLGSVIVIFKDKIWVKALSIILFYLLAIVAETIVFTILGDWVVGVDPYGNTPETLIIQLMTTIVIYSLLAIIVVLWKKFLKKGYVPNNFWLFLIFPISQACMMNSWSLQLHNGEISYQSYLEVLIGLFVGFFADAILFYVLFMQGEKEEMKRNLTETERIMEMEKQHYQTLQEQQENLRKIHHDFTNQLIVALNLLENNEKKHAGEMLEQLKETIHVTSENKWCKNVILNALLDEKGRTCETEQISFEAMLDIPEEVGMQSLHLCSLFANLIDNAIYAAREYEGKDAYVFVKAMVKGKYLYLKVENSANRPQKHTKPRHGYGLQIVKEIVKVYDGQYRKEWADGCYTVNVELELTGAD